MKLEGARGIVDEKLCQLQEYNFVEDSWHPKDEAAWPMSRERAERWLTGWKAVDRFAAIDALMGPVDYPEAPESSRSRYRLGLSPN